MVPSHGGNKAQRIAIVEEHVRQENRHDLDAVMATLGTGARYDDQAWDERHEGTVSVRSFYSQLLEALPDLFIDVKQRYVTEDNVILEVVISGTHQGRWRGMPGTGRRVMFSLCAIYHFDETGKLAGERIYYDRATVLRQMGIFREPTSPMGRVGALLLHPLTISRAMTRQLFG